MSLYNFVEEDFKKTIDDDRFINWFKFGINNYWFTSRSSFRGDIKIIDSLEKKRPELKAVPGKIRGDYDILKSYSLPYISFCEDPIKCRDEYGDTDTRTINAAQDYKTREYLLSKLTHRYNIYWWAFVHECVFETIFIIYPICKLLWPEKSFYLYAGEKHVVLLNKPLNKYINYKKDEMTRDIEKACVFDIIGQSINGVSEDNALDFVFQSEDAFNKDRCVKEEDILVWYSALYGKDLENYDRMCELCTFWKGFRKL